MFKLSLFIALIMATGSLLQDNPVLGWRLAAGAMIFLCIAVKLLANHVVVPKASKSHEVLRSSGYPSSGTP